MPLIYSALRRPTKNSEGRIFEEKKLQIRQHYEVGKKVRKTIAELGGTMPEDLPTPKKSISQIEKDLKKKELDKE